MAIWLVIVAPNENARPDNLSGQKGSRFQIDLS